MNSIELCNGIRKEVEGTKVCRFPIDVFPAIIQKAVMDAVKYDGLEIECLCTAMLSAIATAIGNAYMLHIRGNWYTNCPLYFVIVGRPGTGKTHAIEFAYAPIRERDTELALAFRKELDRYKRDLAENGKAATIDKPHIVQYILSDFTPEALYRQHYYNQRGIVIMVDELLALLKSRNRYSTDCKFIEDLLSTFSGSPIILMRKDEESIITIPHPNINLIGGVQTNLVHAFFSEEFMTNGFTDRLLFVCPECQELPHWSLSAEPIDNNASSVWKKIIRKLMDIKCDYVEDSETIIPKRLELSDDARAFLFKWNNGIVDQVNAIKDDSLLDTHVMKLNSILPRLALIIQAIRWATSESHLDFVDLISIERAKTLLDYFESKYYPLKGIAMMNETRDVESEWINSLPEKFTTKQALTEWTRIGMKKRSMFNHLKTLCNMATPIIRRVDEGVYEKIKSPETADHADIQGS